MQLLVSKRIGIGGFSNVHEATTPEGKLVALKQAHITKNIEHPMLLHEACALSLLAGHPSIPSVYAWGRSQYFEYLTLDLLGSSLGDTVKKEKKLDLKTVLLLLDQMLDCLEHLHSCHLVHCDIKPDNFLLGLGENSRRIHLIDYGFVKYYRNPITLLHHALNPDHGFEGTGQYASRHAHLGLSLSRRDDLESLAYSVAFLLRGALPWPKIKQGTQKHKQDRIREKKMNYPGKRIFEGFPQEFADFTDYVRRLHYDEDPDYKYWKGVFLQLSRDLGFSSDEHFDKVLASGEKAEATGQASINPLVDGTPEKSVARPPVSKGDYILVQVIPRLTIEGRDDDDTSRWHDPTFSQPHWQFPARPALVLGASPGKYDLAGLFILSILPLVHRPGVLLNEEEKRRFVRVRHASVATADEGDYRDQVVAPTPDWPAEFVYHSAPPRALRVVIHPGEAPIDVHWKLDQAQLDRLDLMIKEPYPAELSPEARAIQSDLRAMEHNLSLNVYASVSPLTPMQMESLCQAQQSSDTISWSGPRGFMDEKLQIGRRRNEDNERT
ncbi:kinase-like protein [Pluteus cervinus]|uniref:Kinase-like protein n=1 Tax=Pluteus cervinus TaxID=181527 RepID=A0ACD3B5T2_9AGAR|nr:kinase-like protein [Pluteus cervinus]